MTRLVARREIHEICARAISGVRLPGALNTAGQDFVLTIDSHAVGGLRQGMLGKSVLGCSDRGSAEGVGWA